MERKKVVWRVLAECVVYVFWLLVAAVFFQLFRQWPLGGWTWSNLGEVIVFLAIGAITFRLLAKFGSRGKAICFAVVFVVSFLTRRLFPSIFKDEIGFTLFFVLPSCAAVIIVVLSHYNKLKYFSYLRNENWKWPALIIWGQVLSLYLSSILLKGLYFFVDIFIYQLLYLVGVPLFGFLIAFVVGWATVSAVYAIRFLVFIHLYGFKAKGDIF